MKKVSRIFSILALIPLALIVLNHFQRGIYVFRDFPYYSSFVIAVFRLFSWFLNFVPFVLFAVALILNKKKFALIPSFSFVVVPVILCISNFVLGASLTFSSLIGTIFALVFSMILFALTLSISFWGHKVNKTFSIFLWFIPAVVFFTYLIFSILHSVILYHAIFSPVIFAALPYAIFYALFACWLVSDLPSPAPVTKNHVPAVNANAPYTPQQYSNEYSANNYAKQEFANTAPAPVQFAPAPSPTFFPTMGIADEIKKYKDLLDCGAITQEEFDAMKKQLLNK